MSKVSSYTFRMSTPAGPQGPQGPAGAAGAQGPQGPAGMVSTAALEPVVALAAAAVMDTRQRFFFGMSGSLQTGSFDVKRMRAGYADSLSSTEIQIPVVVAGTVTRFEVLFNTPGGSAAEYNFGLRINGGGTGDNILVPSNSAVAVASGVLNKAYLASDTIGIAVYPTSLVVGPPSKVWVTIFYVPS